MKQSHYKAFIGLICIALYLSGFNLTPPHISAEESNPKEISLSEKDFHFDIKEGQDRNQVIVDQLVKLGIPIDRYDDKNPDYFNYKAKYPTSYQNGKAPQMSDKGQQLGYTPNTLKIDNYEFPFKPLYGNTGSSINNDFSKIEQVLLENGTAAVGMNGIHSFFAHYDYVNYTGPFNPLVDQGILQVGTQAIITDAEGYSKGYEFTQTVNFQRDDQYNYFYDGLSMPFLAYYGNTDEMIYLQYCRWDIERGLLETSIGYRIW